MMITAWAKVLFYVCGVGDETSLVQVSRVKWEEAHDFTKRRRAAL
jgi:hypothetical protein